MESDSAIKSKVCAGGGGEAFSLKVAIFWFEPCVVMDKYFGLNHVDTDT